MNNSEFTFEPLWSVEQAAAFLAVAPDTIHTWRNRHYGPPSYRIGAQIRFRPEQIRAWVDEQAMGRAG